MFGFDRQFKDSVVFANVQKNGSLAQRAEMTARALGEQTSTVQPKGTNGKNEALGFDDLGEYLQLESFEYIPILDAFSIDISDDIDDEAVLGRNRQRKRKARTNTR